MNDLQRKNQNKVFVQFWLGFWNGGVVPLVFPETLCYYSRTVHCDLFAARLYGVDATCDRSCHDTAGPNLSAR